MPTKLLPPAARPHPPDAPDALLSVRFYRAGRWTVAEISGELDVQTAPYVRDLVSCAGPWLAIDLQRVTFVDCSGLALLVAGQVNARRSGGTARLANASRLVQRLVDVLELDGTLPIYGTLADALSAPVAEDALPTRSSAWGVGSGLR